MVITNWIVTVRDPMLMLLSEYPEDMAEDRCVGQALVEDRLQVAISAVAPSPVLTCVGWDIPGPVAMEAGVWIGASRSNFGVEEMLEIIMANEAFKHHLHVMAKLDDAAEFRQVWPPLTVLEEAPPRLKTGIKSRLEQEGVKVVSTIPDHFDQPYPVTIVRTRYGGAYELEANALWCAFPREADDLEWSFEQDGEEFSAFGDDVSCMAWWSNYPDPERVGRGATPEAALADMVRRAKEFGEDLSR